MLNERAKQTAILRAVVDGLSLSLAFFLAVQIRSHLHLPIVGPPKQVGFSSHSWLLFLALPLYWALSRRSGRQAWRAVGGLSLRALVAPFVYLALLLGTAIFLFQAKTFSRAVFFLFLLLGFAFVAGTRIVVWRIRAQGRRAAAAHRKLLVVGAGEEALAFRRKLESHDELDVEIVGHLSGPYETIPDDPPHEFLGSLHDLKHFVEERVVDDVVFVVPPAALPACEQHIAWCEEVGVTVHLKADFVRTLFARTYPSEFDGTPMLTLASTPRDPAAMLLKRVIDLLVAGGSLVLVAPALLLIAALIKSTSHGPVIYSQERVGRNGRRFLLHKFRSMYRDADTRREQISDLNEMTGPVFKVRNDPRVTPLGRWLRKFSLDEVPQLWNVLCGNMSLVGPRPPLADEVRQYERWQRRRLSMKPGITCLWQVNGRNQIQFEEWMKLDLEYIDNWSLMLDLKILLRTVPAVVFARGVR